MIDGISKGSEKILARQRESLAMHDERKMSKKDAEQQYYSNKIKKVKNRNERLRQEVIQQRGSSALDANQDRLTADDHLLH